VLVKTHFLSDASKGFSVKLANKRKGTYRVAFMVSRIQFAFRFCGSKFAG